MKNLIGGHNRKQEKNPSVLRMLLTLRQQSLAAEKIRKSSWEEVAHSHWIFKEMISMGRNLNSIVD